MAWPDPGSGCCGGAHHTTVCPPPQPEWLPTPLSAAPGREVAALCFLGPLLRYSVLSDDDSKVIKKSYAGATNPEAVRMLHRTLQQQLEIVRVRRRREMGDNRETALEMGEYNRGDVVIVTKFIKLG